MLEQRVQIICPNCEHLQAYEFAECHQCRIVFAKWRGREEDSPGVLPFEFVRAGPARIHLVAAAFVLVLMGLAVAGMVEFTRQVNRSEPRLVNPALEVTLHLPKGWVVADGKQAAGFLRRYEGQLPEPLFRELGEHLTHPEFGMVLVPGDAPYPLVMLAKRGGAHDEADDTAAEAFIGAELAYFPLMNRGSVGLQKLGRQRIYSSDSSFEFAERRYALRHEYVASREHAFLLGILGPAGSDFHLAETIGPSLRSRKNIAANLAFAGMVQFWFFFMILGLAFLLRRIYLRMV